MTDPRTSSEAISSASAAYEQMRHVSAETPCPYLPGRMSRAEAYRIDRLEPEAYERLLSRNFRRSGQVVYRPKCRGCHECRQLRVPVETFAPTRSLRRVLRQNDDVRMTVAPPVPSQQKFDLFRAYLESQHDDTMARTYEAFAEFLYATPTLTLEFQYLLGDRLVGVSIADVVPNGLSSVYMYFEPAERHRSLGSLSVLREIEHCRTNGLSYYYLGFHVAQSKTMAYKARFGPHEILVGEDRWLRLHG